MRRSAAGALAVPPLLRRRSAGPQPAPARRCSRRGAADAPTSAWSAIRDRPSTAGTAPTTTTHDRGRAQLPRRHRRVARHQLSLLATGGQRRRRRAGRQRPARRHHQQPPRRRATAHRGATRRWRPRPWGSLRSFAPRCTSTAQRHCRAGQDERPAGTDRAGAQRRRHRHATCSWQVTAGVALSPMPTARRAARRWRCGPTSSSPTTIRFDGGSPKRSIDSSPRRNPADSAAGSSRGPRSTISTPRRPTAPCRLLTFHGAKGREWPFVIVAGAEDGLIPHSSALSAAQQAEEARLFYVAITRAVDHLIITRAESRRGSPTRPSPWLQAVEATIADDPPVPPPCSSGRQSPDRSAGRLEGLAPPGRPRRRHCRAIDLQRHRAAQPAGSTPDLDLTNLPSGLVSRPSRPPGCGRYPAVDQSRSTMTGAWSLGDWPLRALRSITHHVQRSATDAVPSTQVDAHAAALVEVAGAVVPPGVHACRRRGAGGTRRRVPSRTAPPARHARAG